MALAFVRESLVSGRQTVRRMRFMLVGDGLAGKTRVAAALLNAQGGNHPDVAITSRRMGIGCSRLQLHSAHGGAIDAQVWHFAGQQVSYLSHTQHFSARRCLHQEPLATMCLHSACFSQKGSCAVQNALRRGLCKAGGRHRVPDATALDPAEMLEGVAVGAAFERSENVVCDFLSAVSCVHV